MGVSTSKPHPIETKWFNEFEDKLPALDGKTVAVTGCTTGTGFIVARTAIRKGADNVLLLNRPSERANKAEQQLKEEPNNKSNVETIPCDLQDFDSVSNAVKEIKSKYEAVDVLCNNAGVMAMEDKATKDGYDVQIQTNHLSHFLLTKELYPLLQRAVELRGSARVANHSSGARKHPNQTLEAKYFEKNGGNLGGNGNSMFFGGARWTRYHHSKLANTVFTLGMADRFAKNGIVASCAVPGIAATNLQVSTASDGGMGSSMWIMRLGQSAEDGSMPICSACFDPAATNGSLWEPQNLMALKGPAVQLNSDEVDKLSMDEAARKMLWEKSEEACGVFNV